jgi:hypothetical protein
MRNLLYSFLAVVVIGTFGVAADGQRQQFKKGDKVEITDPDHPGEWVQADVILFDDDGGYAHQGQYEIMIPGKTSIYNQWRKTNEIRPAGSGRQTDVTPIAAPRFKKGDQVEITDPDHPGRWVRADIILFDDDGAYGHPGQYEIIVPGRTSIYNQWRKTNEIRAIGEGEPTEVTAEAKSPPVEANDTPNQGTGSLAVGARVDVYLLGGTQGKNRGTILEISGRQIKVHFDGCAAYWDRLQDADLVRPAASISNTAPEISFLVGRWAMTTVGLTRGAVAWGKTAGIQINADGSYIWYQDGGRAPVKGKWQAHAKIPNTQFGTEVLSGLLITDAKGQLWKMTKRVSPLDNGDHITLTLMCSGESEIGTRAKIEPPHRGQQIISGR